MITATESIINFLSTDTLTMEEYYEECYNNDKLPNYSEFCRRFLNGTTIDGYSFKDINVKRGEVTSFIRNQYSLWLEEKVR